MRIKLGHPIYLGIAMITLVVFTAIGALISRLGAPPQAAHSQIRPSPAEAGQLGSAPTPTPSSIPSSAPSPGAHHWIVQPWHSPNPGSTPSPRTSEPAPAPTPSPTSSGLLPDWYLPPLPTLPPLPALPAMTGL